MLIIHVNRSNVADDVAVNVGATAETRSAQEVREPTIPGGDERSPAGHARAESEQDIAEEDAVRIYYMDAHRRMVLNKPTGRGCHSRCREQWPSIRTKPGHGLSVAGR